MTTKPTPRHYFKFTDWLVPAVIDGRKTCTIRGRRKRLPKVGELAVLECWSGRPYASPVKRIAEAVLTSVTPIQITEWDGRVARIKIVLDGVELNGDECHNLATADGFSDLEDMALFFRASLPFDGHLYCWPKP